MQVTLDIAFPNKCRNCTFREYYRDKTGSCWKCRLFEGEVSNNDYRKDKKISDYCLTDTELERMLHAIGYERNRVKKGRYYAYRNYYNTKCNDVIWRGLEARELAENTRVFDGEIADFAVTKKGIEVLESILKCKIVVGKLV